jgi:hypothetical protein
MQRTRCRRMRCERMGRWRDAFAQWIGAGVDGALVIRGEKNGAVVRAAKAAGRAGAGREDNEGVNPSCASLFPIELSCYRNVMDSNIIIFQKI